MIKIQQGRAEQLKQKKRAEEIKVELRKKLNERRMKENGYLHEEIQEKLFGGITGNSPIKLDAAAESEITAQAEAIAAAEAGIVAGVGSGDTESGAGEAASVTVDSASGGGGDISVETISVSEE